MMMDRKLWIACALVSVACLCAPRAHAHFTVLSPASWLKEDSLGGPQKGSPCGPGNKRSFIGDDVQPIPASNAVTSFHAGETITVKLQETVYHPGYFRISLAPIRAADATSGDFPDPPLTDTANCHYDRAAVQIGAHDHVLADGLFMAEAQSAPGRSLMQEVQLPNEPCEHCTLQIVQVMEGHPASSCFYFHCAELEILPAESGSAASAGAAAATGAAGKGAAGTAAMTSTSSHKTSGCSVAAAGTPSRAVTAWCLLAIAAAFGRRRRSRSR